MKTFLSFSLVTASLLLGIVSSVVAGEIVLENGDRITGDITMIADGTVHVATDYAGEIQIDFTKVASVTTDKIGRISLTNGDIISGRIQSISDGTVTIAGSVLQEVTIPRDFLMGLNQPSGGVSAPELEKAREQLAQTEADLEQAHEQLVEKEDQIAKLTNTSELWNGSFAVGTQLRRGNSDTSDVSVQATAIRKIPKEELQLKFSLDYGETDGETDTNDVFGEAKLKVFQTDRRYLFGLTSMEYDEMEDLDLRAQAFGGPGYIFIKTEKTNLLGEVGAGLIGEFFDEDDTDGDTENFEASLWLNAEWTQKIFEKAEFYQGLTVFPSLGDFGEYRVRSESTIKSPLAEQWAIKLSLIDTYDSNPESENVDKNDLRFTSLLEYTY